MPTVVHRLAPSPSTVVLVGAGDPGSSRLVYAMVIGLIVIGLILILLGFWIVRQTKPDLEVLAPLERMGDGDWKKKDPSTQRRMLDELRPEGAKPLTPASRPPAIDEEFERGDHPVTSFSDLGPGVAPQQRDPTPTETDLVPEIDTDTESEPDSESVPEIDTESEPESETEPDSESEAVSDPRV